MLPTPDTAHVPFERIYEPAEDSYLLLDTLSSVSETAYLSARFPISSLSPLVTEIGTGSGVVLAFANAHAVHIFGRSDILTLGIDINIHACRATAETIAIAGSEQKVDGKRSGSYVGNVVGDLQNGLRRGVVDVLIFNPPYVPTPDLPTLPVSEKDESREAANSRPSDARPSYEDDSAFLALSYAGGEDGMETTNRMLDALPYVLSERGVAYILLCAHNKPEAVKGRLKKEWGESWEVATVGSSGKKAGWEKLVIVRIARVVI